MDPSLTFGHSTSNEPSVTQLDFHQSMNHFKTMFPSIDEDVIEAILRSNQGAVDATIDQLLQISNENAVPVNPPSYTATVEQVPPNTHSYNLNLNSTPKEKVHKSTLKQMDLISSNQNQLIDFDTTDAQACAQSSRPNKSTNCRFNPPFIGSLPNDFLRIQEKNSTNQVVSTSHQNLVRQSSASSSGDHQFSHHLLKKKMEENERQRSSNIDDKEIAQYLEDERIAIMLQNQEFVSELRHNSEFMNALNYDAMSHNNTKVKGFHNDNYTAGSGAACGDTNSANFSDADFKERIKRMGEVSRKKFAQLAGLFSRRKGGSLVPSRDNLLLGDQYATLENDCSDSEEYGKKPPIHSNKH